MAAVATLALLTGGFPDAPPRGGVIALTSAPDGGWTHVHGPHAIHEQGVTYFGLIDGDDGHIKVGAFDHATGVVTLTTLGTAPEVDTHDNPSVHVRDSDGRIMVFWTGHLSAFLRLRISSSPRDISSFAAVVDLDAQLGGDAYTYPAVYQLDSGTLSLFYRDHDGGVHPGRLYYSTSANGGTTWTAGAVLAQQTNETPYWVTGSDDSGRVDIAIGAANPANPVQGTPGTVHHLWTDGSGWYAADGSSLGSPPFEVDELPRIYDAADGNAWPTSIIVDGDGRPAFTFEVLDDPDSNSYRRARWTGSAWEVSTIIDSGGTVESGVAPHACMDPADPDVVYASVKVGSRFVIRRYRHAGGTWHMTPVTEGAAVDDIFPEPIRRAPVDRRIVWLRGTYTTYLDTALGVMAGR